MLCILIPLLVGLICALLGYLLGKLFGGNSGDLDLCKDKVAKLEADLEACQKKRLALEADLDECNKNKLILGADLKSANANLASNSLMANNSVDEDAWKNKVAKLEADIQVKEKDVDIWKNKVANLKADLEACNQSKLSLESNMKAAVVEDTFNADAAKAVFGKRIKQDDLKVVEGIGPKIEGLFHNFGIKTWKALSEASVEKCQEVLNSGGERYKIHNPGTWPKQSQLAYEGKWEELLKWQDELDGGKA